MFGENSPEKTIDKQNKKAKELAIRIETLDQQENELLKELKVTPQQLSAFITDSNNFSEKNWQELKQVREKLDRKLSTELENITDPLKTQKAFKERKVDNHWIFVR